jgi:hypothetical protein
MKMTEIGISIATVATILACHAACGATVPSAETAASPAPGGDPVARRSIPEMQGCYSISYQFVSDGDHDYFLAGVVEYIDIKEQDGGYRLRHFMVQDKTAFHHFTEEWTPVGDGRWRQRVKSGLTGALRYEAIGSWNFNQWEGSALGAAKPIRDTKQRYATLDRRSSVQITRQRWVQAENNTKRLADGTPIASEVGWVQYERTNETKCAPAIELSRQTP